MTAPQDTALERKCIKLCPLCAIQHCKHRGAVEVRVVSALCRSRAIGSPICSKFGLFPVSLCARSTDLCVTGKTHSDAPAKVGISPVLPKQNVKAAEQCSWMAESVLSSLRVAKVLSFKDLTVMRAAESLVSSLQKNEARSQLLAQVLQT